jgi:hypothetical protein
MIAKHQRLLQMAERSCAGAAGWRQRKLVEARKLLELAELAGPRRMSVEMLDLSGDLRAAVRLHTPVPMEPGPDGRLGCAEEAVVGIHYPRLALSVALPGLAFATLLEPRTGAFHPNIGRVRGQRLCLGAELPAGIPVTELVLLSYGLLTLQSVTLDPDDSAGVMNGKAARWWQANTKLIPLSREPFIAPETRQMQETRRG